MDEPGGYYTKLNKSAMGQMQHNCISLRYLRSQTHGSRGYNGG